MLDLQKEIDKVRTGIAEVRELIKERERLHALADKWLSEHKSNTSSNSDKEKVKVNSQVC
jgi:hypothetical protein